MKKISRNLFYIGLGTIMIFSIGILNAHADDNDTTAKLAYSFYAQKNTPYYDSYTSNQPIGHFDEYNYNLVTYYNPKDNRFRIDTNGKTIYVNQKDVMNSTINFNDNYGYQHYTRNDLNNFSNAMKDKKYHAPNLEKEHFQDVIAAKDNKGQQLNVWDSWPLQDSNNNEVTYKGYHVTFALAGKPGLDPTKDSNIYAFYQKMGDESKGVSSWKLAGKLFNNKKEGNDTNDSIIKKETQQWSGQTVLMNDGSIRVFYTSYNPYNKLDNNENIATAKIDFSVKKNGLRVNHNKTSDRKNIFSSEGNIYQNPEQVFNNQYDEFALRDPHYFESNGHKYLLFEANAGIKNGYQGRSTLYNLANYGNNKQFQSDEQNNLFNTSNSELSGSASSANGVIGIIELDNNFKTKKVMNPLMGFNTVDDEMERPNLFKHNGKWYLFAITQGRKISSSNIDKNETYMLGFTADNPMGPFNLMNGNGLVISSNDNKSNMYSYLLLNNKNDKDDNFIVTQYMINPSTNKQTFGKSFLLNIKDNNTKVLNDRVMPQGSVSKNNVKYKKVK